MKVLFLDVDGVLNTNSALRVIQPEGHMFKLDALLVDRLKVIVEETGCELVLSSAWRMFEGGREFLEEMLETRFLSQTERLQGWRGEEIQLWLKERPEVTNYAIVDDDGDMLESQLRNFFQTDPEHGLTETIAYRITYHLKKGSRYDRDKAGSR